MTSPGSGKQRARKKTTWGFGMRVEPLDHQTMNQRKVLNGELVHIPPTGLEGKGICGCSRLRGGGKRGVAWDEAVVAPLTDVIGEGG